MYGEGAETGARRSLNSSSAEDFGDVRVALSSAAGVFKKRFLVNVGSNIGFLIFNSAMMIWYVPFLIRHLGMGAYGMVSLSNTLVEFAAIISGSLDVSVSRYLAIDVNRSDFRGANRTFNTSLAISFTTAAALLIVVAIVTPIFPRLFNIPAGLDFQTKLLFSGVAFTMLAAIIGANFSAPCRILHRFDLFNATRALTLATRVCIVTSCFLFWSPSLEYVALGLFIAGTVGLLGDAWLWRRLAPQLRVDRRDVDLERVPGLLGLSGWSIVNFGGGLLIWEINLVIVNMLFGADMTGRYGSLLVFPTLIETMTEAIAKVLSPMIIARYAVGDIAGVQQISCASVRILGLILALPIGLLCGFAQPTLALWLGREYAGLDILLILLIGHLTCNLAIRPLAYVATAYNRVKAPGVATFVFGVFNVFLAIIFAKWCDWGVAGVAAASALTWTLKNVGFLSTYSALLMGLKWWRFYGPLSLGCLAAGSVWAASRLLLTLWWPTDWMTLMALATSTATLYVCLAYFFGLSRSDRAFIWRS